MNTKHYFFKIALLVCLLSGGVWWFTAQEKPTDKIEETERRESPEARRKGLFKMLKDPVTGKIPRGHRLKEYKAAMKVKPFKIDGHHLEKGVPAITITSRGPNNYGGRTRALAFDTRTTNVVLSGGVSSGIFRSTDNGVTWTNVTPAGMIHNLTCIAQDTRTGHQDTWYAGTGEKEGNSADLTGAAYYGFGMWKSTDNGVTWSALSSTQSGETTVFDNSFDYISKIIVNPSNGDILAMTGETIRRSTDGGDTWGLELGDDPGDNGNVSDLIYNAASSTFYAAINGQSDEGDAGMDIDTSGVWSSTDGDTWTQIRTETDLDANGVKRIVLSSIANTNGIVVMYELRTAHTCSGGGTSEVGLQEFDGTSTWIDHTDKISTCAGGSTSPKSISLQEGYNMCITTKPNDANLVYLGGVEIFRYNLDDNAYDFIGGSQSAATATNLHVDNHILLFEDNDNMWAGNDGGLRETDVTGTLNSDGFVWSSKSNGYVTYQYFSADINPTNGSNFVVGAAQDNAFTIHPTDATAKEVGPTADGISIAISSGTSLSSYQIFAASQEGGLSVVDDNVETDIQPNNLKQPFHSLIYLDADNTNYLYYPYTKDGATSINGFVRTRNAINIADGAISSNPTSDWQDMTGVRGLSGSITTFNASRNESFNGSSYSASDANRKLYFGTDDGKVYRLNDPAFCAVGTTPTEITPSGASGYVSDIATNPWDDKEIIVTYSNYGNVENVWHTSDASVASPSWTAIEGPANTAVSVGSARSAMITKANNVTVYMVGTSTGLYGTDALSGATTSWTRIGTDADIGLAICVDMRLRTSDNKMVLATHGNGLFMLEFPMPLPVELASFTGEATTQGNQLNWSTLSEENNKGFDIEKSTDGETFEKIGFVAGNGTTLEEQTYQFLDKNITNTINYYRLKQVDFDGDFEYSDVVAIESKLSSKTSSIKLYPNPAKEAFTIELNDIVTTSLNVQIVDKSGRLIQTLNLNPKANQHRLDQLDLAKGIYFVKIMTDNYTETIKLIQL